MPPVSARRLNKVIIFVAEGCNLRCVYCYEQRRRSDCAPRHMDAHTARQVVASLYSRFGGCNYIQFFGGEPSLNMGAVRAIVEESRRRANQAGVRPPDFGIVTNGASRHSAAMVDFCIAENIAVTVSVDGPAAIHDALRPSANGRETSAAALATLRALQSSGAVVAIESVYTARHIELGCSIVDLFRFVRAMHIPKLIFHTVYPPAPPEICPFGEAHFAVLRQYHEEAVDWWFDSLLSGEEQPLDIYFKDLLLPMLQGGGSSTASGGCPAGTTDISIGPDGDAYSCHLLYGETKHYLGNILNRAELLAGEPLPKGAPDLEPCADCFASAWCQPCGALNANWGDAWTPARAECEIRRAVIGRIGRLAFQHLDVPINRFTAALAQQIQREGT